MNASWKDLPAEQMSKGVSWNKMKKIVDFCEHRTVDLEAFPQ